jgi:ribosomal protein S18 acetylase RimI-like enzyme
MQAPAPGQFWKTPFVWEPGDRLPSPSPALRFETAPDDWLTEALASVMADSLDESDRHAVAQCGAGQAVRELMAPLPTYFDRPDGAWKMAIDVQGRRVGFVLPVLFKAPARFKEGRPQGTIFYMGVLPAHRGQGHALQLLHEATRSFIAARCWRIFCDASSANEPMLRAFRQAGYNERTHWQRPLA